MTLMSLTENEGNSNMDTTEWEVEVGLLFTKQDVDNKNCDIHYSPKFPDNAVNLQ